VGKELANRNRLIRFRERECLAAVVRANDFELAHFWQDIGYAVIKADKTAFNALESSDAGDELCT
jgi:hypothetical protein